MFVASHDARIFGDTKVQEARVSNGWKDILEQAGDADLGAALIRLARQAAALHQFQAAGLRTESTMRMNGIIPGSTVQPHGGVRREVNA